MTVIDRTRRFPLRFKVAASSLLTLVLMFGYIRVHLGNLETRRWQEMRRELEELARQARARDPHRLVLRGAAQLGNACDGYEELFRSKPGPGILMPATDFLYGNPPPSRKKVEAALKGCEYLLDGLRRATHHSEAQRVIEWELGIPDGYGLGHLGHYAIYQARILREEGHPREAAEVLLDIGQFSEDNWRNTDFVEVLMGVTLMDRSLVELKHLVSSGECDCDDLLEVARELEVLDQNFPNVGIAYVNTAMEWGFGFLAADRVGVFVDKLGYREPRNPGWRYGFSSRILMADAFESLLSVTRRWQDATSMTWEEEKKTRCRVIQECEHSPNPLVRMFFKHFEVATAGPDGIVRECRAHLRLLRIGTRWKARGDLQVLEDPFGGKLLSSSAGGTLKLWSVGPDGVDDGGIGEWSSKKGKDIVLEVSR